MEALKKTSYDPNSRQALYLAALLSATIGAIAFYLSRMYYRIPFAYDSGLLFRGAWALRPFILFPWMVIVGVMIGRFFNPEKIVKYVFGIIGAILAACIVYMSLRLVSPNYFTGYTARLLSYGYLQPSITCIMSGAVLSSMTHKLYNNRESAILFLVAAAAMVLYLLCEYLLRGYTSPIPRPVYGTVAVMLHLFSSISVIVISICLAALCRSQIAMRLTRHIFVRWLLIVLCFEPALWQVWTAIWTPMWEWPILLVNLTSPLVVLAIYFIIRMVSRRLAPKH